jgi:uncharacterized protein YjbJ (UPF0337 family)
VIADAGRWRRVGGSKGGTDIGVVRWFREAVSQAEFHTMDEDRVKGAARSWAGKAEGAVGDVAGDADTEAAGRMRDAAGKVQNMYGQAKDAARDAAGDAIDYACGPGSDAVAKAVRDNPLSSILIAAGIGFTLALMLRPQPRPRRRWRYYE